VELLLLDGRLAPGFGQPLGQPAGGLLLTGRAGAALERSERLDD
jgi:hypothetical protein